MIKAEKAEDTALQLWLEWFEKDGEPYYDDDMGNVYCFFCGQWQLKTESPEHERDCVYLRAKRLIAGLKSK